MRLIRDSTVAEVALLLSPRWKKFRNRFREPGKERLRLLAIAALVAVLWAVIYVAFHKALVYFTAEDMFGTVAATKFLSMILVTFAFVALISNIVTTFSTFYLADDLELILSAPVSPRSVFMSRFLETLADSSWMALLFGLPVFVAYGRVFSAPWSFYVLSLFEFTCLLVMVAALGIFVVECLVRTFPVRRLRDLFVFVGILIFIGLYLLFRMMRPEEFLNPEGFASMMDYLSIMSESSSPFLPTTWILEALRPFITGRGFDGILFYGALSGFGAWAAYRLAGHHHQAAYFDGFSKSMESKGARLSTSRTVELFAKTLGRVFDAPVVRLVVKETLLMARDWGRLSQLLLLLALILVYLYNFSVLPSLDSPEATFFLKNLIAFINIGLAGFVLSSLGVRFLFPAMSAEGRAFWILKSSPIPLRKILWVKFFFYLAPMLALGLFLVIMTNRLLGLGPFISAVSTITIAFLTVGITSLSIGMGVLYADFRLADPGKAFAGFGGLLTMIYGGLAVAAVIAFEVYPVYRILVSGYFHHVFRSIDYVVVMSCFAAAMAVALFLIIYPLRTALGQINELES